MTTAPVQYALLFVCWITALVTLVVFLESWFALTRRSRLAARRSNGAYGVVSVVVLLRGEVAGIRRSLQSILDQSYPFVELLLVHEESDESVRAVVREFGQIRSHVPVRPVALDFRPEGENDRIRALDEAQPHVRGSWILVMEPDIVLDQFAIESALEFAGTEDITAVSLTPGTECRSLAQRLLGPSLEWFVRMVRVIDRGREKKTRVGLQEPFLLLHGHTHTVVNRINRLPGILNESGWTLWSFRVEGLRTFQGDGAGWISREATARSLLSTLDRSTFSTSRVAAFLLGSTAIPAVSVAGILFGLFAGGTGFSGMGILYFAAFSYSLMATSYYFYSRRLGAAAWFAPLWFLAHFAALLLMLLELARMTPVSPGLPSTSDTRPEVPTNRD